MLGLPYDPADFAEFKIYYLHGLESKPFGTKYRALDEHLDVYANDYSMFDAERDIEGRVAKGLADIKYDERVFLVGSSFGGLMAALMFQEVPEKIVGMVLLAPALTFEQAKAIKTLERTVIIHGEHDELIPFDDVARIAAELSVPLIKVKDTHRLHNSLATITSTVKLEVERALSSLGA